MVKRGVGKREEMERGKRARTESEGEWRTFALQDVALGTLYLLGEREEEGEFRARKVIEEVRWKRERESGRGKERRGDVRGKG